MRVLWLCNIMLPAIAMQLGKEYSVREGWLSGTLDRVILERDETIQLGVCFPVTIDMKDFQQKITLGEKEISCFGFYENLDTPEIYQESLEDRFAEILSVFQPDIVHIFGTEFPHSLSMAKAFNQPERILVGLQGIISECAKSYMADIPKPVQQRRTFRDRLKKDSILQQQEKFRLRGENEIELLSMVGHVTGRTAFDKRAAISINENLTYHQMNETMRSVFYEDQWQFDTCIKHKIFFSQADYPLKGFHYLLEALPDILQIYPDTQVVVAGNSIMNTCKVKVENNIKVSSMIQKCKQKIKISSYGKYLDQLVKEKNLQTHISILGKLSAEEMKQEYLSSHTFICASSLENSPNSVAEAMLLGVPVVAAAVGGVPSMITHRETGILYHGGKKRELSETVIELWGDGEKALLLSKNARVQALQAHNSEVNYERLLEIYQLVGKDRH